MQMFPSLVATIKKAQPDLLPDVPVTDTPIQEEVPASDRNKRTKDTTKQHISNINLLSDPLI